MANRPITSTSSVRQAAMHQNLVDDHLEEQRRDQSEHLQEERGDQHLAEQMPVFMDRPHEPGYVEAARHLRQSSPACHQDQFTVPECKEFSLRHQDGSRRIRGLDQDLVLTRFGNDHEPAVTQRRDRRQRRFRQPRPVAPAGPRLEAEILGAPEHFRCANLCCSEPMPDLLAVNRNALEMQERHKTLEPRIRRCRAV